MVCFDEYLKLVLEGVSNFKIPFGVTDDFYG